MSTVKISQLPNIPGGLNANTSNSLFLGVDIPTGITGKFTATQLAERLYANNVLNVGDNPIVLPNVAAQFAGDAEEYLQINLFNSTANGSADYVATADTGTDTTHYINLGINNSNYGTGALDGYLVVAGDATGDPGGNLMIGSITSGKEIDFVIGGFEAANVVAKMIDDTGFRLTKKPIIFADGTSQNTAAASASFSQEAFATANVAGANTVAINTLALSAYNKANNALANTSGTFGGDLNIIGTVTVNSTMVIANSNFGATEVAFRVTGTGSSQNPTQAGTIMQLTGKANTAARVLIDSFGTSNAAYAIIAGRSARGTVDAPTPTQNNDILLRIAGNSYGTTGYAPFGSARIDFVASENHSDTSRGSRILFYNTPNGSNVVNQIASFNANTVEFLGTVNPQKGFVYTPNNITSLATSLVVDFERDSMKRFSVNDNATITLQNFVYGKIVEVWITNSAAQNKTITHGCFANNSTAHATTFTIQSQSCAYLKYFSIDGDLANTYVSITA